MIGSQNVCFALVDINLFYLSIIKQRFSFALK